MASKVAVAGVWFVVEAEKSTDASVAELETSVTAVGSPTPLVPGASPSSPGNCERL
jgi:hypothetical protein